MSTPVSDALCIQWANVRDVTVGTASTTNSGQLPGGTVAVRLVSATAFYVSAVGSASSSGSPAQAFVPANTPLIFEAGASQTLSFRAVTSANPNSVNITPLAA